MPPLPEIYDVSKPTPHVPNSPLPVLVYRSALPSPVSPSSIRNTIEPNNWLQGGIWKHYGASHFHSVTHECYAVFSGSSRLLLGRGPLDEPSPSDVEVVLGTGDIIVLPAGVSHCSLSSEGDYEYVGLYPKGSPHWDNNFCRAGPEETKQKEKNARAVPLPECDPIFGPSGPLVTIWREAMASA